MNLRAKVLSSYVYKIHEGLRHDFNYHFEIDIKSARSNVLPMRFYYLISRLDISRRRATRYVKDPGTKGIRISPSPKAPTNFAITARF